MSATDDDRGVPDLAEIDEDAPTNLRVPDFAGAPEGDATVLAEEGASPGHEAATIVSVDPAGARAGRDPALGPALGDPGRGFSSNTATDLVDMTPAPEIETGPGRGGDGAKEVRLPDASESTTPDETGPVLSQTLATPAKRGVTPQVLVASAIAFGALVVAATFLLVTPDDTPLPEPEAPPPLAPVAVGEPAGTVYATPTEGSADLERQAADLVAAGRVSEAVGVYEAMLDEAPERREIAIALEVLKRRVREEPR